METPSADSQQPIGEVTAEERDMIRSLHLRKVGLVELFTSLSRMNDDELRASRLYERLVEDMGAASQQYQDWWDAMARQYDWEPSERGWRIDFDSCAIYVE